MTLQLLPVAFKRFCKLIAVTLRAPVAGHRRLGGALLLLTLMPFFLAWQLLHWLGFLLDDVFFRGWRRTAVNAPVFVLGPPRSGTTHLHRVLALDDATTTFRTWECLFALSVSGRKLCLLLAGLDQRLGRPLGRLAAILGKRLTASFDAIHVLRMNDPEEDFLCLLPVGACFVLVAAFPRAEFLWEIARADIDLSDTDRRRLATFYRACVQKHLYVFGEKRRFLSKNASFSGMPHTLRAEFPDASFLVTVRDPAETLPSQLSALSPALRLFGNSGTDPDLRERFAALLLHYYEHLADFVAAYPEQAAVLYHPDLHRNLAETVRQAMQSLQIEPGPEFEQQLVFADAASRRYRSRHRYSLDEFALDRSTIARLFSSVYARYPFA